jgi:hypothetical protein
MRFLQHVLFIVLILLTTPCFAEEPIKKVKNPSEVSGEVTSSNSIPKEIEGLQWNRWTSRNFTVCALSDTQAQYLHKHLELVKGWTLARWGLYDIDFSTECKVIVVDRPDLFKKLFNLDSTKVEIRRDQNGKIKENVIFLLANEKPSQIVPIPLTEICLNEFCQKHNIKTSTWSLRGMAMLNGSIDQIKGRVLEVKPVLERNDPMFFSKGILDMDAENYRKLDDAKKRLYDNCTMMFCLMIRKEYGQDVYIKFMKQSAEGSAESAVKTVLGFNDYTAMDITLKRYMIDLTREIAAGKTPDHYLQIREKSVDK